MITQLCFERTLNLRQQQHGEDKAQSFPIYSEKKQKSSNDDSASYMLRLVRDIVSKCLSMLQLRCNHHPQGMKL